MMDLLWLFGARVSKRVVHGTAAALALVLAHGFIALSFGAETVKLSSLPC